MTVETQWATREEMQELKAAQSERIARLEVQVGESDKRLATKADLVAVKADLELKMEKEFNRLRIMLIVGFVLLIVWEEVAVLERLLRLVG